MPQWTPFKDALFYPVKRQRDRRVVLSEKEIYLCRQNNWTFNTTLTTESGKRLVGYIMKQMESVLRKVVNYKYKISSGKLNETEEEAFEQAGIDLKGEVKAATLDFYRESTKTIVSVDPDRLRKIREEALQTQEKLIVPEEQPMDEGLPLPKSDTGQQESVTSAVLLQKDDTKQDDPWMDLRDALTEVEREALRILWKGDTDIRQFADSHGIMLEVLAEGINEKAMDYVGDGLLDGDLTIYEDYVEQIAEILNKVSGL